MDLQNILLLVLAVVVVLGLLVWHLSYRLDKLKAQVDPSPAQAARGYLAPTPAPTPADPNYCTPLDRVRQFFRRFSWYYLLAAGLVSYPYQLYLLLQWQVAGLPLADRASAKASYYAKLVDPVLFYSKVSISVGVFCLINLLAWASLRVIPVLVDWATGYYREEQRADFPLTPGFKGTFLKELSHAQRMAVYLAVWGLEMLAAWGSVEAGFRIQ